MPACRIADAGREPVPALGGVGKESTGLLKRQLLLPRVGRTGTPRSYAGSLSLTTRKLRWQCSQEVRRHLVEGVWHQTVAEGHDAPHEGPQI